MTKKYKVSILGCGWYGLELGKKLSDAGFPVSGSTTTQDKLEILSRHHIDPYLIDLKDDDKPGFDPAFFDTDILILTLPPKRASNEQQSFTSKIQKILEAIIDAPLQHVIFISSTSVYGDNNQPIDELGEVLPVTDSGKSILAAENLLKKQVGFATTVIRFAGLIGPGRDPGNFFAGKKDVPNGQAPVNLIHLNDCIGITMKIIEKKAFGHTFNACAPDHPQKQYFYTQAAINSGLPKPEFLDELKQWKIVSSIKIPQLLNYTWQIGNLGDWLHRIK